MPSPADHRIPRSSSYASTTSRPACARNARAAAALLRSEIQLLDAHHRRLVADEIELPQHHPVVALDVDVQDVDRLDRVFLQERADRHAGDGDAFGVALDDVAGGVRLQSIADRQERGHPEEPGIDNSGVHDGRRDANHRRLAVGVGDCGPLETHVVTIPVEDAETLVELEHRLDEEAAPPVAADVVLGAVERHAVEGADVDDEDVGPALASQGVKRSIESLTAGDARARVCLGAFHAPRIYHPPHDLASRRPRPARAPLRAAAHRDTRRANARHDAATGVRLQLRRRLSARHLPAARRLLAEARSRIGSHGGAGDRQDLRRARRT